MNYKNTAVVFALVAALSLAFSLYSVTNKPVCKNNTVYPVQGLTVYYLYPERCAECDLGTPGACDYCNSYYDLRLMDLVSQEVGVPLQFAVSDAVVRPNVFVETEGRAYLGDARTRYNIANNLCRYAGVEKSCSLYEQQLKQMRDCIRSEGVEEDAIIYHTSSENCPRCSKTDAVVEKIKEDTDDDGNPIKVHVIDHSKKEDLSLLKNCMDSFDNIDYAPQLLCPNSGLDLTGEFNYAQAIDFIDSCH